VNVNDDRTRLPITVNGNYVLDFNQKTFIMGILNATPDSFSDGGRYNNTDRAIEHAMSMVRDGADIIDIGGESTRPGFVEVAVEEEISRVVPIISAVASSVKVPISIDTYKAEVAKQAIEAGAHIINDIWGAKADPNMAKVASQYQVPIILMHNRNNKDYDDLIDDMIEDLTESIEIVKAAGVPDRKIILDPGIGFAKTFEDNIKVLQNLEKFKKLGFPVLLGTSRKGFIGQVMDLPPNERGEGTGATTCIGIQKGCDIVRVHDVLLNARLAKMTDVLVGKGGALHR